MAPLPPLAEIPPSTIRLSIAPEEWEACLESWLTLSGLYLRAPIKETASVTEYLKSLYRESAWASPHDGTLRSPRALRLRKACFLLVKRALDDSKQTSELVDFDYISDFCRIHARNASLPALLKSLWQSQDQALRKAFEQKKASLLRALYSPAGGRSQDDLRRVADVVRISPEAATVFMTGSDFVDSLASHYQKSSILEERKVLVATVYFGLLALVKAEPPNASLISDHQYS